jgi:hypothetical protein
MKQSLTSAIRMLALCACVGLSGPAFAQDDAARAEARELATQGIGLFSESKFIEAIGYLERAEAKFHAPTHLLYMARARAKLGENVQAHKLYVDVLAEQVPNYAPDAFHKAQEAARGEIGSLNSKVARLKVAVVGNAAPGARVTLDGNVVPSERLAFAIAVTPGEHSVEASAGGLAPVTQTVNAAVGSEQPVELALNRAAVVPSAGQPAGPDAPVGDGGDTGSSSGGGSVVPAVIAFGLGGAALAAGAITGAMTLSKASDIKGNCTGDVCPLDQESDADSAKTLGNISTVMFVVGGVAVGAGVVLLLTVGGDDSAQAKAPAPQLGAKIGLGSVSLVGSF